MFTFKPIIARIELKSAILLFLSICFLCCLFLCWWNSSSALLTMVQNSPCAFGRFPTWSRGWMSRFGLYSAVRLGRGHTRPRSLSSVELGNIWHLAAMMFFWSWHPKPVHVLLPIAFLWGWICVIYILPSPYLQSLCVYCMSLWTSLVAQMVRNPPTMQETQVWSLVWGDPLEKEMAPHSNILAWRIPWTEEPGGLQSMGLRESDTTERLTLSLSPELTQFPWMRGTQKFPHSLERILKSSLRIC